jgi:hypothetical protein
MIKVAIVGTNGLAQLIANLIATQTYHQFIILSRNASFLFPQFVSHQLTFTRQTQA